MASTLQIRRGRKGEMQVQYVLQIVTAELQIANVAYLKKKSNYPYFLHIRMALRPK